jgi:cell division septum initiation protein DivIVA
MDYYDERRKNDFVNNLQEIAEYIDDLFARIEVLEKENEELREEIEDLQETLDRRD